jgi:hypothetical protein
MAKQPVIVPERDAQGIRQAWEFWVLLLEEEGECHDYSASMFSGSTTMTRS